MFDRLEYENLYMDDETLLPIVIKYSDRDVEIHNSHKDVPFSDYIKQIEGVHDFVVINRGVNEKNNYEEFEKLMFDICGNFERFNKLKVGCVHKCREYMPEYAMKILFANL